MDGELALQISLLVAGAWAFVAAPLLQVRIDEQRRREEMRVRALRARLGAGRLGEAELREMLAELEDIERAARKRRGEEQDR